MTSSLKGISSILVRMSEPVIHGGTCSVVSGRAEMTRNTRSRRSERIKYWSRLSEP